MMNAAVRDLQTLFGMGVMGALSDGQLLDRFVERREGAVFEAIVRRHGPMVWGVCRRVLRDHHDAEDAFQATFLVLARKAASIMPREKLGNWLYGVAYQTATKARAMRAKRRVREGQVPDMPEPMAVPDDLRDDLAESLDRELSRLPEKYRTPIILCDLEGRTHREAASQLGWPIGTVSSRLSRARSMLAKRLTRRGMSLSGGSLAVLLAQESASASMPTAVDRFHGSGRKPVCGGGSGDGGGGLCRGRCPDRGGVESHVTRQAQDRDNGADARRCRRTRRGWIGLPEPSRRSSVESRPEYDGTGRPGETDKTAIAAGGRGRAGWLVRRPALGPSASEPEGV